MPPRPHDGITRKLFLVLLLALVQGQPRSCPSLSASEGAALRWRSGSDNGSLDPALAASLPAAGDSPQDNPLPPPRTLPPGSIVEPPSFLRPNRYDVWQYHAVDRYGRFRPLVIASPHGPYYLLTGKPYPYALLHSLNWMPYIAH